VIKNIDLPTYKQKGFSFANQPRVSSFAFRKKHCLGLFYILCLKQFNDFQVISLWHIVDDSSVDMLAPEVQVYIPNNLFVELSSTIE
jgi:hypothetical protein